ncbi:hypothetical protein GINT2_000221 [Glugoides intestinalis]
MLRIRLKTEAKEVWHPSSTLNSFFTLYFNSLYSEMNAILSDFHSIQEHAFRNKVIEFTKKKLKDFDLLQTFVRGAFLFHELHMQTLKGNASLVSSTKIVQMADFLAMLFENMKTGFIPAPNFNLALQTYIDYHKLLPADLNTIFKTSKESLNESLEAQVDTCATDDNISEDGFEKIHRMMKIYMLKEDSPNFTIENGILTIHSLFFKFDFALCGEYENPHWQLFKVKSYAGSKRVEDQFLRRLPSIELATKFIEFFENRKKATDIFKVLEEKSGFYQTFTGKICNNEISGYFLNNIFHCKVTNKGMTRCLKSPSVDDFNEIIMKKSPDEDDDKKQELVEKNAFEYRPDLFGPNRTFFSENMFFCISENNATCFFGEVSSVSGIFWNTIHLKETESSIVGVFGNYGVNEVDRLITQIEHLGTFINRSPVNTYSSYVNYLKSNYRMLCIIHSLRDLSFRCLISNCLLSDKFYLDSNLKLSLIEYRQNELVLNCILPDCNEFFIIKKKLRLLLLQEQTLSQHQIIETSPGMFTSLLINNIQVRVSDIVVTDNKFLTEDCKAFNITKAIDYIINFGVLYKYNLLPTVFSEKKVCFMFSYFVDEAVEISIMDNGDYTLSGEKTLKITKLPCEFSSKDTKVFLILYKFFLADRFIFLKKELESRDISQNSNVIDLGDYGKILLTQEGIKFKTSDPIHEQEMNLVLNSERNVLHYFRL